jgi:hypothetical protein
MDVGGVDETDGHGEPSPNKRKLVAGYITPERSVSKAMGQIGVITLDNMRFRGSTYEFLKFIATALTVFPRLVNKSTMSL